MSRSPSFNQSRRDVLRMAVVGTFAPGVLAACVGGSSGAAPTYDATIADARDAIRRALADSDTASITVALADRDRIVWSEAFGYLDKVNHVPPGTDTMYCIGSVSKVLAATAAMILVDRGQLVLDAPVVRYVTDFRMASPEYAQVTVRMLLSHSSGFPGSEYRNIFSFAPFAGYAAQAQKALATERLKDAPGELAVYCNDGFTMSEQVILAITGKTYTQFVQDEILAPLGMAHSRYALAPFPPGSFGQVYDGNDPVPQEFVAGYATGGLYSTPSDMARLALMFMNGGQLGGRRILSEAAVAEMSRYQTVNLRFNPATWQWGLGWDSVAHPGLAAAGVACWQKNGGTAFYGSDFYVTPVEKLAVMISGTTTTYGSGALAERILLHALAERGSIAAVPPPLSKAPKPEQSATDAALAAMAGVYAKYDAVLRVDVQANRTLTLYSAKAKGWEATATGLKLRSDGTFSTDAEPNKSYRAVETDGRRYLFARAPGGNGHYTFEIPYAQRVEPGPALSAAWRARVGMRALSVNDDAQSVTLVLGGPLLTITALPECPGYVIPVIGENPQIVNAAASDERALMMLKIPMTGSRDLNDLVIEKHGNEEWVRFGSTVYRPQATMPTLARGGSTVTIGSDGYAEWRRVPASGAVAIAGCTAWKLYDADLKAAGDGSGSGGCALPGHGDAAYLMLFGAVNAAIGVTIT